MGDSLAILRPVYAYDMEHEDHTLLLDNDLGCWH